MLSSLIKTYQSTSYIYIVGIDLKGNRDLLEL